MADEIAKIEDEVFTLETLAGAGSLSKMSDDEFNTLRSSAYLPRLQLMTATADKCKKKEFPIDHYALVEGSAFIDLGETVDVLILAFRPKALDMSGEEIVTVYDKDNNEFKDIAARSENKDSGCMWGYEFLVWIGGVKRFATFFCGSKSARREAPNIKSFMNKAATLRSKYIETKKFSWQGIDVCSCSTPMSMPTHAGVADEIGRFNNPPTQTLERIENAGGQAV
jgi:hypothetical protein